MGPWMDGCVPDSSRYVPGRKALHVSAVVTPAATSVPNDCTRGPCGGGTKDPGAPATGQVTVRSEWEGLATHVAPPVFVQETPSPPPTWPKIVNEVGTVLAPVPVGKERLFVRLMVRLVPVDT